MTLYRTRFCCIQTSLRSLFHTSEHSSSPPYCTVHCLQVAEGRNVYIEMAGNISAVTKPGDQLRICFHVFHESRLPFSVRVRDSSQPAGARMAFISEPRPARNGILGTPSPLPPVCTLNIALPDDLHVDSTTDLQTSLEQPTLASSSAHCLNGSCRRTF